MQKVVHCLLAWDFAKSELTCKFSYDSGESVFLLIPIHKLGFSVCITKMWQAGIVNVWTCICIFILIRNHVCFFFHSVEWLVVSQSCYSNSKSNDRQCEAWPSKMYQFGVQTEPLTDIQSLYQGFFTSFVLLSILWHKRKALYFSALYSVLFMCITVLSS